MARRKTFGAIKVATATFDNQDNLVKIHDRSVKLVNPDNPDEFVRECDWVQNLNLDNFQPHQVYGLRVFAEGKLWFKSSVPLKGIQLNNFRFFHKVKKINQYHFEVECHRLQEHLDGTDYIEVLIRK